MVYTRASHSHFHNLNTQVASWSLADAGLASHIPALGVAAMEPVEHAFKHIRDHVRGAAEITRQTLPVASTR